MSGMRRQPVVAVGAVAVRDDGALLLVRRGQAPALGRWSLPGGRVEWAEVLSEALRREVVEETGLEVTPGGLAGLVERIHPDEGFHYVILDYHVTVTGGNLRPGSDVTDARWVLPSELGSLELSDGLVEALRDWGVQTSHRPKLSR
ncbi:MAG TPA: NUDIX domain-containing protein [Actinomycetota bacterium]|nr:NUDIX domain-containing protein [Actinomycetota bacterium]